MNEIWTTVHGGWGDSLASYGNICALLREKKLDKANVVFFGMDTEVINFLNAQTCIHKVRHLKITNPTEYHKYIVMGVLDFPLFTRMTGLNALYPDLIPTHISHFYQFENQDLCNRDFSVVLPPSKFDWTDILPHEPFLLMQPFSCHSCKQSQHWPHWIKAIDYVLKNTLLKVVLIGELKSMYDENFLFPWIEHPNLINLVGQTPSMIDVFHIMGKSIASITTSNGLSMWSIVSKKPSLVVCNQIINNTNVKYYYNWINHDPNTLLDTEASFEHFCIACDNFLQKVVSL
jgi:hypothetical protein